MESQIRDLARKLSAVAAGHPAFPQVALLMQHVDCHLGAMAFAEEMQVRVARLENTVSHLCPDKSADV